jgi:hypothetical protein
MEAEGIELVGGPLDGTKMYIESGLNELRFPACAPCTSFFEPQTSVKIWEIVYRRCRDGIFRLEP